MDKSINLTKTAPNDNAKSISVQCGGVQKSQKCDDVIYEWSLIELVYSDNKSKINLILQFIHVLSQNLRRILTYNYFFFTTSTSDAAHSKLSEINAK